MVNKKKKTNNKPVKEIKDKNLTRTSYYSYGSTYNPQSETGIQGAYGSQGERDDNNSYTRS